MTTGYTKLFSSILTSTIWGEDCEIRIMWITMLATANRDGIVEASIPGLARIAGVPVEKAEEALKKFAAPDAYSRTTEHDGRRIEPVEGGWLILNYEKYRFRLSEEDKREKAAERQRKHRASIRESLSSVSSRYVTHNTPENDVSQEVTAVTNGNSSSLQAEAEAYSRSNILSSPTPSLNTEKFMERIRAIGFRDSNSVAAEHEFIQQLEKGADPVELVKKLARIFRWTANQKGENGHFAPKLYEVIRRWEEPQHYWQQDRKNGEDLHPSSVPYSAPAHIFCAVCKKDLGRAESDEDPKDAYVCSEECEKKMLEKEGTDA